MNQKLKFLCFRGIHNSLPSFWAKFVYSWIKIDHIVDSLLKLQIKIGVHLINVELSQLLTLCAGKKIEYPKMKVYIRKKKNGKYYYKEKNSKTNYVNTQLLFHKMG